MSGVLLSRRIRSAGKLNTLFTFEYLSSDRQQFTIAFFRGFTKVYDWLGQELPDE
jgi:hypothetical protein